MRKFSEALKIALQAIWRNKLRSGLTALGIIIGVFSVIALVSIVSGLREDIVGEVEALGADLVLVTSGAFEDQLGEGFGGEDGGPPSGGGAAFSAALNAMTDEDIIDVKNIDGVKSVSGHIESFAIYSYGDEDVQSAFLGHGPNYFDSPSVELTSGRGLTDTDVTTSARVMVISDDLAPTLFGDEDPIGETVLVNKEEFEIIGTSNLGTTGFLASAGFAEYGVVPYTTISEVIDQDKYNSLYIMVHDSDIAEAIKEPIQAAILENHDQEDFTVITQEDIIATIDSIIGSITLALLMITAISLVVGGIGIMNIMLVSVTERTREIGIRKALGATNFDILFQFLIEAILLSVFGGLLGLALAYVTSFIITATTDLPSVITINSVLLAIGVSAGVGVVFGLAPAIRAAAKKPIEALRYE